MSDLITIIKPDEMVTVGGSIEARVLSVSVSVAGVDYQVGLWADGAYQRYWLPESEVTGVEANQLRILACTNLMKKMLQK